MVDRHQQLVLVGPEPEQHGAEQRAAREVEGPLRLRADDLPRDAVTVYRGVPFEVDDLERDRLWVGDPLHGLAVLARESCPQRLVPAHQLREGIGERGEVERAVEPPPDRDGVG